MSEWKKGLSGLGLNLSVGYMEYGEILKAVAVNTGQKYIEEEYHATLVGPLQGLLDSLGGEVIHTNLRGSNLQLKVHEFAVVSLIHRKSNDGLIASFNGVGDAGLEALNAAMDKIKAHSTKKPPVGSVYSMVSGSNGISLQSLGAMESKLERTNYPEQTISDYDHIIGCLHAAAPCGRITILDGPPGTGKSFIIRALASEAKAVFILVSPGMIGQLSGPALLGPLMNAKETGLPLVLILEDADSVLVKRNQGDKVGLAEILNLGDGLLGQLIDVRIIATTNARITEMDPAIVRPGRLCRHVSTEAYSGLLAQKIYRRLCPEGAFKFYGLQYSLADIYLKAREDGWMPEESIQWNKQAHANAQPTVGGNFI